MTYVTTCRAFSRARTSQFCESQPVFTQTKACSATYTVTQRAGEKSRHTNVYVHLRDRSARSFTFLHCGIRRATRNHRLRVA